MPASTRNMPWWDFRQYAQDFTSGNASLSELFQGFLFATYWHATQVYRHRFGVGAPGRWLYDRFQAIRGGTPFPLRLGLIPKGKPTPVIDLNLQPGELDEPHFARRVHASSSCFMGQEEREAYGGANDDGRKHVLPRLRAYLSAPLQSQAISARQKAHCLAHVVLATAQSRWKRPRRRLSPVNPQPRKVVYQ